ncbi:MSHA biogenesis protein MshK [Piscinibacter sp.]|uniref:MSHA biogenesis protein MshK n=1 Tax=Piscinibacter sp. TaxID=1903157 RepID=UPI002BEBC730|nr:MSHA biogenesis protein MshK [Albitalea sp.]HUG21985.1 MSHA biogenesis protein MshK [Albitalea sp.]
MTLGHALAFALAALPLFAQANALRDPTRPPEAMLNGAASAASAPAGALQLQSVLLGAGRRPAAVISGELVLLGGRVGDTRLVRVTERSAVLQGPNGQTTLALTPDATKQGATRPLPETHR